MEITIILDDITFSTPKMKVGSATNCCSDLHLKLPAKCTWARFQIRIRSRIAQLLIKASWCGV
jgi:hypothetical protein